LNKIRADALEITSSATENSQATNENASINGNRPVKDIATRRTWANSHRSSASLSDAASQMTRLRRIEVLGNYLLRQCGIATFTTHLCDAVCFELPFINCFVLAMYDSGQRYAYPDRVRFEIEAAEVSSYHRAADFQNLGDVSLVSVQHGYRIFGSKEGCHALAILRELRIPIVTTLHTVLSHPNKQQHLVMDEITRISE
jgi:hypothetical protein